MKKLLFIGFILASTCLYAQEDWKFDLNNIPGLMPLNADFSNSQECSAPPPPPPPPPTIGFSSRTLEPVIAYSDDDSDYYYLDIPRAPIFGWSNGKRVYNPFTPSVQNGQRQGFNNDGIVWACPSYSSQKYEHTNRKQDKSRYIPCKQYYPGN